MEASAKESAGRTRDSHNGGTYKAIWSAEKDLAMEHYAEIENLN